MDILVTDNSLPPDGWETKQMDSFYVHYNPTTHSEEDVAEMIDAAMNGDNGPLYENADFDTPTTRELSRKEPEDATA